MIYLIDRGFRIKNALNILVNQCKCPGIYNECFCLGFNVIDLRSSFNNVHDILISILKIMPMIMAMTMTITTTITMTMTITLIISMNMIMSMIMLMKIIMIKIMIMIMMRLSIGEVVMIRKIVLIYEVVMIREAVSPICKIGSLIRAIYHPQEKI